MEILGWLDDLKYTLTNATEELGDTIKEKAQDLGDALSDVVEDSYEVFERRGDQKFANICNKIYKIEQADSIREKVSYALNSSRELRNIERKEEFNKRDRAKKGDIIGVLRSFGCALYEHYGIYIGNDEVIHFTKSNGKNIIIKTSMKKFMEFNKSDDMYFILDCEPQIYDINNVLDDIYIKDNKNIFDKQIPTLFRRPIEIYSPEETVSRAKQYIGEQGYNLLVKNCEHFAIWCKTGLKHSYQLDIICKPNNKKWIDYSITNK